MQDDVPTSVHGNQPYVSSDPQQSRFARLPAKVPTGAAFAVRDLRSLKLATWQLQATISRGVQLRRRPVPRIDTR